MKRDECIVNTGSISLTVIVHFQEARGCGEPQIGDERMGSASSFRYQTHTPLRGEEGMHCQTLPDTLFL